MKKVFSTPVTAAAANLPLDGSAIAQDKIKIGYAVSKTGSNAPGAGITTIPNDQPSPPWGLWGESQPSA